MRNWRSHLVTMACVLALLAGGVAVVSGSSSSTATAAGAFPTSRVGRTWPFAWSSIWNMPRGEAGALVPAGIPASTGWGMTVDEDVIVMEPDAPKNDIVVNTAGWDGSKTRCGTAQPNDVLIADVPIPDHFSTEPDYLGSTPNMSAALLMDDGTTVVQTQPFHRCGPGGVATSQYRYPTADLHRGDGIVGAHGGSAMSSLGGTIRLDELVPGGAIRHALKVNLNCAVLCSYAPDEADGSNGYRWPALAADSDAANRYGGTNPALQMGSLLSLPPTFDESTLGTEPARIVARAMRDYGAYVVDDTGWDVYSLATEWSPQGRVIDEFAQSWGFDLEAQELSSCESTSPACQWSKDMAAIYTTLAVVDDNAPTVIGGAGRRMQPCAPAFSDGTGAPPLWCSAAAPAPTTTSTTATPTITPTTITPTTNPPASPTPPAAPPLLPSAGVLKATTGALLSRPVPLDGAAMASDAVVSITFAPSAAGASTIELWLDDPMRNGPARHRADQLGSHDDGGGDADDTVSFVLGTLSPGPHTATVLRTAAGGEQSLSTASFVVTEPGAPAAPTADLGPTGPDATTPTPTATPTLVPSAPPTPSTVPAAHTPAGHPSGDPGAAPIDGDVLRVSTRPDRSGAVELDGAQLPITAAVAVQLDVAEPVSRVSFWLDGGELALPPQRVETVAPYDFAGGTPGTATLLSLQAMRGAHRIVAVAKRLDGTTVQTTATFTVR